MVKLSVFLILSVLTLCPSTYAQSVSSADVNIVSTVGANVNGHFVCTTEINNQNDDDSRATKVIILLPLQVSIVSMTITGGNGKCTKGPLVGSFTEFAVCSLGTLPQGPTVRRTIQIDTTRSTALPSVPQTCGAFIYSAIGDIQKLDNYMVSSPVS